MNTNPFACLSCYADQSEMKAVINREMEITEITLDKMISSDDKHFPSRLHRTTLFTVQRLLNVISFYPSDRVLKRG